MACQRPAELREAENEPSGLDDKPLNFHMKIAGFRHLLGWRAGPESAKPPPTSYGTLFWPTTTTSSRKIPARPIFARSPSLRR